MTKQIKQELINRTMELARTIASYPRDTDDFHAAALYTTFVDDASAIVAELPAPVDPDLLLARSLTASQIEAGRHDESSLVSVALAAIKRARAGA